MRSRSLFTHQLALKLGYFHWLRVKNSNPLLTELSPCYLKHTKFYLEHKASFILLWCYAGSYFSRKICLSTLGV